MKNPKQFLEYLNKTYLKLHTSYEKNFWLSYMGDHSVDEKMNKAEADREAFSSNIKLKKETESFIKVSKGDIRERLKSWNRYFSRYQAPAHALPIKEKVAVLEAKIMKKQTSRKEGYVDPKTGDFVEASENKMRTIMRTHDDEAVRKACFESMNQLPYDTLDDYLEIIKLRNEFAKALGYDDFYDYKLQTVEEMSKKELFSIFNSIYDKTKYAFKNIRKLEKAKPGLRKPWNFSYMMAGSFVKEEDPYFQFEDALMYWGKSFSALGMDFQKGTLTLDLIDRKGKYNNGFCHQPVMVHFKGTKMVPGASNFTCNAVPGQVGSGLQGLITLFHEGGHAAHFLNSTQKDVCLNHEYPPMTVGWAETQSMFMDSVSSSIEWKTRYARNKERKAYPFDLYERKMRALDPLRPLDMMGICRIVFFEKEIYEKKNLTKEFIIETAKKIYRKCFDFSEDSLGLLNTPHIYSWNSSAYYHGYGLAELAVEQWREYFYKKYGYIADNPKVGKEMQNVWNLGSLYSSKQFIKIATGKSLSPEAFIRAVTKPLDKVLKEAKQKIKKLEKVPIYSKPIRLNARINMVHGKKKIADNRRSFEEMDRKYRAWLKTL